MKFNMVSLNCTQAHTHTSALGPTYVQPGFMFEKIRTCTVMVAHTLLVCKVGHHHSRLSCLQFPWTLSRKTLAYDY